LFFALASTQAALKHLRHKTYDIIICDYTIPGFNGLHFFKSVGRQYPRTLKILITANPSIESAVEAMRIGIHDYIQKPLTARLIENALMRLLVKPCTKKKRIRGIIPESSALTAEQ
jgi:DNA-binding NtrC family response regulator